MNDPFKPINKIIIKTSNFAGKSKDL